MNMLGTAESFNAIEVSIDTEISSWDVEKFSNQLLFILVIDIVYDFCRLSF